jgi:hypothetical protein
MRRLPAYLTNPLKAEPDLRRLRLERQGWIAGLDIRQASKALDRDLARGFQASR